MSAQKSCASKPRVAGVVVMGLCCMLRAVRTEVLPELSAPTDADFSACAPLEIEYDFHFMLGMLRLLLFRGKSQVRTSRPQCLPPQHGKRSAPSPKARSNRW